MIGDTMIINVQLLMWFIHVNNTVSPHTGSRANTYTKLQSGPKNHGTNMF